MITSKEVQSQSLFLVIPSKKDGRKLETLVWRVVARHMKKLELRIQFNLQVYKKIARMMNRTRF